MDSFRRQVQYHFEDLQTTLRNVARAQYLRLACMGLGAITLGLTGASYWKDVTVELLFLGIAIAAFLGSVWFGVGPIIGLKSRDDDKHKQIAFAWHVAMTLILLTGVIMMTVSSIQQRNYWYGPSRGNWNLRRAFIIIFAIANNISHAVLSTELYGELPLVSDEMIQASKERARKSIIGFPIPQNSGLEMGERRLEIVPQTSTGVDVET